MAQSVLLTHTPIVVVAWHARASGAAYPQNMPEPARCLGPVRNADCTCHRAGGMGWRRERDRARERDIRYHRLSVDGRRDGHQARPTDWRTHGLTDGRGGRGQAAGRAARRKDGRVDGRAGRWACGRSSPRPLASTRWPWPVVCRGHAHRLPAPVALSQRPTSMLFGRVRACKALAPRPPVTPALPPRATETWCARLPVPWRAAPTAHAPVGRLGRTCGGCLL